MQTLYPQFFWLKIDFAQNRFTQNELNLSPHVRLEKNLFPMKIWVYETEGSEAKTKEREMFTESANAMGAFFTKSLPQASKYSVMPIHSSNLYEQEVDITGDPKESCTLKAVMNALAPLGYTITVTGRMTEGSKMDCEAQCGHFNSETRVLTFTNLDTMEDALRLVRKYYLEVGYESEDE